MIEFEMKFKVSHQEIKNRLLDLDAKFISEEVQLDQYFDHPLRDFKKTDEALRIRSTPNKFRLTYKGPKFDARSKTRLEIDTQLLSEVQSKEIYTIFENLSFKIGGIVEKQREKWELDEFTVVLDTVKGLGEFVEIEALGSDDQENEEIFDYMLSKMYSFTKHLGLNPAEQITQSYLELLDLTS